MSSAQARLVTWAALLAESAWLSALCALVGLAVGLGAGPLGLLAVLAIMSSSFLVARGLGLVLMPPVVAYSLQMIVGALVVYVTLGTQVGPGAQGVDLGWAGKLASGAEADGFARGAAVGAFLGVMLWWRGGRLASTDSPTDTLATSFRWGIVVLSVAAVVDIFSSSDLKVFRVIFMFFAAGLAGLSVAHILPMSRRANEGGTWPRVVGGVVSAVLVTGLLFSLLQKSVLSVLSTPVLVVLDALATVVFFVIVIPLAYLFEFILRGLAWLAKLVGLGPEEGEAMPPFEGFGEMVLRVQEETQTGPSAILHALEWMLLAMVVAVLLFLLARAFRGRGRWWKVQPQGARESVGEGADPAFDMAHLLFDLLPGRFKRSRSPQARRLPEDAPDVVDVFRVYFGLLALAEEKGYPRPTNETPAEYQRTLERVLPSGLVRMATTAFIRACYGHRPAPREQIDEMRASLERLTSS